MSLPQSQKKRLTKAEFGEVLSGTFNYSDKRWECCNYLLINGHYTFKNVQITFKLKNRFTCDSFNLTYVVICGTCKEEYIGETGEGKTKLRDRVYRQCIAYIKLFFHFHLTWQLSLVSLSIILNILSELLQKVTRNHDWHYWNISSNKFDQEKWEKETIEK